MFTGRRFDIETGLYYYRARYYNPHIGRFMQTDPVGYGAGINWYLYCGNNPLSWVDSTGREPVRIRNKPGWINDVWKRAAGHPSASAWPGYYPWPYYTQHYQMSCAPVAILNWWLTYDIELDLSDEYASNDIGAENYVKDLLTKNKWHDWSLKGTSNLSIVQDIIDPDADPTTEDHEHRKTTLVSGAPAASTIVSLVTGDTSQAVIVAYDTNLFRGRSWHAITIVSTPVSMQDDVPGQTISVIGGTHPHPYTYTPEAFTKWWTDITRIEPGVHYGGAWGEYIIGDVIPTPDPGEYE
jgi:RHS repeat-associated protein